MTPLLKVSGVRTFYGAIEALRGVDIEVAEGEIVTLIGSNGAGKSTLLMTICGNPQARAGEIRFADRDITRFRTWDIVRLGIAQTPEGRRIFPRMTVLENLQMGAVANPDADFDDGVRRAFELFPVLGQRRNQSGGTLSGGEQQMLAIARALISRPKLLLLDEPSLGLAPRLARQIFAVLREINQSSGTTIFLVEQNAYHALRLCHRGYVLANGMVTLEGTGGELLENPAVQAAYLGGTGQ